MGSDCFSSRSLHTFYFYVQEYIWHSCCYLYIFADTFRPSSFCVLFYKPYLTVKAALSLHILSISILRRGRGGLVVNTSNFGSRGRGFEPHSGRHVVSLSKTYLPPPPPPPPPKVLVIPRKRDVKHQNQTKTKIISRLRTKHTISLLLLVHTLLCFSSMNKAKSTFYLFQELHHDLKFLNSWPGFLSSIQLTIGGKSDFIIS